MESLLKPAQEEKKQNQSVVYILLVVGIVLLASAYIFIIKDVFTPVVPPVVPSKVVQQPTGMLYTSMAKDDQPLAILGYRLGTTDTSPVSVLSLEGATTMQFEGSDGSLSFAVFSPVVPEGGSTFRNSNIIMFDAQSKRMQFVLATSSSFVAIRHLNYSSVNGLLTFTAKIASATISSSTVPESADAWGVYSVDPKLKVVTYIGKGMDATFSPDGSSLVYVSADGLMQYTYQEKRATSIAIPSAPKSISMGSNMNLDISPDGKLLAISSANDNALYVHQIISWNPVILRIAQLQPTFKNKSTIYWPTFSFDNKFLAYQAADVDALQRQTNPRIEIISLDTMKVVRTLTIDMYDFTRAFIDDWQVK